MEICAFPTGNSDSPQGLRISLFMQEAAIQSFPDQMAELQAEYTAQQKLYRQVKSSLTSLERELRGLENDVQSRQDVLQATVETQEEARKQQQEASEVKCLQAITLQSPLCIGKNVISRSRGPDE